MLRHLGQHLTLLLFRQRADTGQVLGYGFAQPVQQAFEQLKALAFVFVQRIALGIAAKSNHRAQMLQGQKMFAPFGVDGLQQNLLFDVAHGFGAKGDGLFGHHLIRGLDQTFADFLVIHAVLGGPFHHRLVNAQLVDDLRIKPFGVPLISIGFGRHMHIDQIVDHLMAHVGGNVRQVIRRHDLAPLAKDHPALIVHHIVKLQDVLALVKIAGLNLGLGAFQRFVYPRVNDRLALLETQRRQHLFKPIRPEYAHQIIFEAQIEHGAPRIALAARAAAQLVVDAPAFVALGGHHVQPPRLDHLFLFLGVACFFAGAQRFGIGIGVCGQQFENLHLKIAAQLNVGATPGHVGGDGDHAQLAGIGNDLCLFLVLAGIEHVMGDPGIRQQLAERLGLFDRGGAGQNRLALGVGLFDRFDHALILFPHGAEHPVIFIHAGNGPVGRHFDHAQPINLGEFLGFGQGGAGHTRKLVVKAEKVLERDAGQGEVFRLDFHALFRLDRLVQTIRQAPPRHHAAGELVDQHHRAIADDIILVPLEQFVRPQTLVDVMHHRGAFGVIK